MAVPLLLLAAGAPPMHPAPADDTLPQALSVAAAPGGSRDAVLKILLKPYETATGLKLGDPGWDGSPDGLRKILAAHGADLVLLDGASLFGLCKAQALARLDWAALGRERYLGGATGDCGAGAFVSATVLAWDKDKAAGVPNWADFWDVARHPGRRGLRRGARGNLEIALMADGVSPGEVYRMLRSNDGVDRAFRKLDQLKPYIVWWERPGQPLQLLAAANALMTTAPASAMRPGPKLHVGTQWAGNLWEVAGFGVPAGAAHARGAVAALLIASDPARQAEFSRATGLGPATSRGFELLPVEAGAENPSDPAHLAAGLAIDESFWAENGEKLEQRFSAWAAR